MVVVFTVASMSLIILESLAVLNRQMRVKTGWLGIPRRPSGLSLAGCAAYTGNTTVIASSPIRSRMVVLPLVRRIDISMAVLSGPGVSALGLFLFVPRVDREQTGSIFLG